MSTTAPKPDATILVVDDEPDILEVIEHALKRIGYKVVTAGGGREAVDVYDKEAPALVLTDVRMAKGNGRDLALLLRTKTLDVPVLFMTGFSDVAIDAAYAMGVNGLIFKPFDFRNLARQVAWHAKPVAVRLAPGAGGPEPIVRGVLKDALGLKLGRGGLFLEDCASLALVPDDGVTLDLRCDDVGGQPLRGVAMCRWVRAADHPQGRGIGLEIVQLEDETRRWFAEYRVGVGAAYIPAG